MNQSQSLGEPSILHVKKVLKPLVSEIMQEMPSPSSENERWVEFLDRYPIAIHLFRHPEGTREMFGILIEEISLENVREEMRKCGM